MEATITPKYVNEPRGNSRFWSVKDANGGLWSCTPEVANYIKDMQAQGAAVVVTYEEKAGTGQYAGRTFKNIKSATASAQPAQKSESSGKSEFGRSEDIFVCGVVNSAIAHQSFPVDARSLANLVANARAAWKQGSGMPTVASTAAAMRNPDPDDPIPF